MNNWPVIIQDWFYPPTCLLCGDPGRAGLDLCPACEAALPRIRVACPRCALPLFAENPQDCGRCQRRPPVYDAAFALFHYEEPVRHLIQSLKFGARYPSAKVLGTLLAEALRGRTAMPEVIIPVPLHRARYRERGFNQAAEIAQCVSRTLRLPLDTRTSQRIRPTAAQAQLPARERRKNLRNAFAARSPSGYRHVAVLDDVVTTGTTVTEFARTLKKTGIEKIEVWACARAGG